MNARGQGRPPKPTAVKKLAGNPGKRPLNEAEPDFRKYRNAPPAPASLDEIGAAKWKVIASELTAQGILASTDLHNLEAFCEAYSRWHQAAEIVKRDGITYIDDNGYPKKHPANTIAAEAIRAMVTLGGSLGLDPSSRSRLTGINKESTANPFAALLN